MKRFAFDTATIRARLAEEGRILIVLAGPNGAGKSTFFAGVLQPLGLRFVNADEIAKAFWPNAPVEFSYEAAELAETVRQDLLSRGISFCMETVFSDPRGAKLGFLRQAQANGYVVFLFFIGVASSAVSITRVAMRTEEGGHDVPDDKIVERFPRTLRNLATAITFTDVTYVFDNSSFDEPYRFVAEVQSGTVIRSGETQPEWWTSIAPQRNNPA